MHIPVVVHHLELMEQAIHVAFELLILVYLPIAELLDCLCELLQALFFFFLIAVSDSGNARLPIGRWLSGLMAYPR